MTRRGPQRHPRGPFSAHRRPERQLLQPFSTHQTPQPHLLGPFLARRRSQRHLRSPFSTHRTSQPHLLGPFSARRRSQRHLRSPFSTHQTPQPQLCSPRSVREGLKYLSDIPSLSLSGLNAPIFIRSESSENLSHIVPINRNFPKHIEYVSHRFGDFRSDYSSHYKPPEISDRLKPSIYRFQNLPKG